MQNYNFAPKYQIRMLTPLLKCLFHVCFDGVRPQGEGDKKQGYNHPFDPTVQLPQCGINNVMALRNVVIIPIYSL